MPLQYVSRVNSVEEADGHVVTQLLSATGSAPPPDGALKKRRVLQRWGLFIYKQLCL
jgi:hypothetical protein